MDVHVPASCHASVPCSWGCTHRANNSSGNSADIYTATWYCNDAGGILQPCVELKVPTPTDAETVQCSHWSNPLVQLKVPVPTDTEIVQPYAQLKVHPPTDAETVQPSIQLDVHGPIDVDTVQPSLQVNIPAHNDASITQQVEGTPIAANMSSNGGEENNVNELEYMNLEEEFNNMQRAAIMIRHCHPELYSRFRSSSAFTFTYGDPRAT